MKNRTKSKKIYVPVKALEQILKEEDDFEIWADALTAGLTTMIPPQTQSEQEFYDEEVAVLDEIARVGADNSPLFKSRWALR